MIYLPPCKIRKEEQIKHWGSRGKEIIKIRADINKLEIKK